jgi:peptide/nickel transport system substrate-binding protein
MIQINEYLRKTVSLGDNVSEVSRLLNQNNDKIKALTRELEILFTHFSRGDELVKIIYDYSRNLQQDISKLKQLHSKYENTMADINDQLLNISQLLKTLINMLQQIQNNANLFVESAKALANLAKNTEICAHHAKREGKGLAIIAKECLSLARLAQLPFQNFSSLLNNLEQLTKPAIEELGKTIALSTRAGGLLKQSFTSLKTIDETTVSLQNIINQLEQNNIVNNELKENVSEGLDILKKQLVNSLYTIDEISNQCSQMHSLAQMLDTLRNTLSKVKDPAFPVDEVSDRIRYLEKQYNFLLRENTRFIEKFSERKKPPLFPKKIFHGVGNMTEQIDRLYASVEDIHKHKSNLGKDMNDVIDLGTEVDDFLKEIQNIYDSFQGLGKKIDLEVEEIEELVSASGKIFNRIKTLAIYAKIEEGRSSAYRSIIAPIVGEFIKLETETEKAFADITPQLAKIKKNSHALGQERIIVYPEKIRPPDYSKIKVFLDDIDRVFSEEKKQADVISKIISGFGKENRNLVDTWRVYENTIKKISDMNSELKKLLVEKYEQAPLYIKTKNILTVGLPSEPLTLKPDQKTDTNSHQIICNCSCGLFQFGNEADIIPGLCEEYSVSKDGKEYTFRLRSHLRFNDGTIINAEHIKDALVRALKGPNSSFFDMITNAKDLIAGAEGTPLGVDIIDANTLRIHLDYPFRPFLANLACNLADPYLDEKIPVGAGPFRIIAWEKEERIILEANDHYLEGRPAVDEIDFLVIKDEALGYDLFKNHALSVFQPTGETLKQIRAEMPNVLYTIPEMSIQFLCMNCSRKPFDNKIVRQAIAHAINTGDLVSNFLRGSAIEAKGIFPPSMQVFNHHLEGYKYDPEQSIRLLKDAGYTKGLTGTYKLDITNKPGAVKRAEYIKDNLMKIGIRIDINPMPWHSLIEKVYAGDSLLSFRSWVSDNGDPDNFVYPLFHSASRGRSGNTFFLSSPDIDNDIDRARKIRNFNQRNNLYQQIEQKILDEAPGVFIYHRLHNLAIQNEVLGIKPHPLGLVRTKYVYPLDKHGSVNTNTTGKKEKSSKMVYAEL